MTQGYLLKALAAKLTSKRCQSNVCATGINSQRNCGSAATARWYAFVQTRSASTFPLSAIVCPPRDVPPNAEQQHIAWQRCIKPVSVLEIQKANTNDLNETEMLVSFRSLAFALLHLSRPCKT